MQAEWQIVQRSSLIYTVCPDLSDQNLGIITIYSRNSNNYCTITALNHKDADLTANVHAPLSALAKTG